VAVPVRAHADEPIFVAVHVCGQQLVRVSILYRTIYKIWVSSFHTTYIFQSF
jgi:hypothetical protein